MNIKIVGRNLEVTDEMKKYAEKRLGKFDKLIGGAETAVVTLTSQRNIKKVEVTIPLDSIILRGEHQCYDVFTGIDEVVEKIERQVRKHKTRLAKKMKEGSANRATIMEIPEELKNYDLVRRKTYTIKPLSVDEAIMQMDLLGHSFFVFVNEESEAVNVLYRRYDGNYGLLEPEK